KIELEDLLEWAKETLVVVADVALREEQAKGFDKNPIMLVDGRKNKLPENVNPWGSIEFISRQHIGDIVLFAYTSVLELSKVKTGRYKSSHVVTYNGRQIATSLQELGSWMSSQEGKIKNKDIFRIINTQP